LFKNERYAKAFLIFKWQLLYNLLILIDLDKYQPGGWLYEIDIMQIIFQRILKTGWYPIGIL